MVWRSNVQERPRCLKVAKCGKKHYGECLVGNGSRFGCGNQGHKVRYFPMIASRGREGKQVSPSVPKDDASKKRRFYAICSRVEMSDKKESDDDVGKFSLFCCNMSSF